MARPLRRLLLLGLPRPSDQPQPSGPLGALDAFVTAALADANACAATLQTTLVLYVACAVEGVGGRSVTTRAVAAVRMWSRVARPPSQLPPLQD